MCTHRTKYAAQMGMAAATERHSDTGAANSLSAVGLAQQYTKAPHGQQMIAATTPHTNPQVGPTILHLRSYQPTLDISDMAILRTFQSLGFRG
mmetsp:Transcript_17577/g.52797  ORF Transcript_17577/g.52797 Transcript_17577/m.52797 type:complete len:93 (-) Transcript_17577:422-700(-)